MSATAERNGTAPPVSSSDPLEALLDRLHAIEGEAYTALVTIEEDRERVAARHAKERVALRMQYAEKREALAQQHKREASALTANATRLRKTLHALGVETPPATKLGAGGVPQAMLKSRPVRAKVPQPKASGQRAVIAALLALTANADDAEFTIREIEAHTSASHDVVRRTMALLRDEQLVRKGGVQARGSTGGRAARLWGVWNPEALTRYMEALDAS